MVMKMQINLAKLLKFILFVFITVGFTGCLDIYEKIDVKKDGSGTVTMDMDMSQMLEMMQQYMGTDGMAKAGLTKMDTTINMKDILVNADSLPADKKAVLNPGSVHIRLDTAAKIFTTHMSFPFTSQNNLQKLYATLGDGSLGSVQLLKALQNDPQLAQIKQAGQMGIEINYTTTIVLPRPVKKIDNATAKLSDDKKTVVMKFNLIEAFDHPEQFGYSIEY
jgi:hypothetical protein